MPTLPRAPGIAFIESKMVDTCTVTRDVRGVYDDVLNEATGELEPPEDDSETIYTGKCLVAFLNTGDKEFVSADSQRQYNVYKALLPQSTTTESIRIGDTLTVTAATNNAAMVGESFRVSKIENSTHPLYTRLMIESNQDAIGIPTI